VLAVHHVAVLSGCTCCYDFKPGGQDRLVNPAPASTLTILDSMNFSFTRPGFTHQPVSRAAPAQAVAGSAGTGAALWWPPVALSLIIWALLTLLLALAMSGAGSKRPLSFSAALLSMGTLMLPLAMLGVGLAVFLASRKARRLSPPRIALIVGLLLTVFLPLFIYYEQWIGMIKAGRTVPAWWQVLATVPGQAWFIDGFVVCLVFAAQLGFALWRHERERHLALQASRKANLALRLSLLQGQLEPNFLLATLDGIAMLVHDAERSLALRALARLSDLLRYALRVSQQPDGVSLADELEFMRHYLALQGLRPDLQLAVQWETARHEWATWACPPLLMVPLLDLAIKHHPPHQMLLLRLTLEIREKAVCWCMQWPRTPELAHAVPEAASTTRMASDSDLSNKAQYLALAARLRLHFSDAATLRCFQDGSQCRIKLVFPASQL
jgi:hypothetical protein